MIPDLKDGAINIPPPPPPPRFLLPVPGLNKLTWEVHYILYLLKYLHTVCFGFATILD